MPTTAAATPAAAVLPDAVLNVWETSGSPDTAALAALLRPVHPVHRRGAYTLASAALAVRHATTPAARFAALLEAMPAALAAPRFTVVPGPAGWYVASWGERLTGSCWGYGDRAGAEDRAAALTRFWPASRAV